MAKIALSPSTQDWNQYIGGAVGVGDSEEFWMRSVCGRTKAYLEAAGHEVLLLGQLSASANVAQANAWYGCQWYVAVHTNAGGGQGTECFYYVGSAQSLALARGVYNAIAPVSIGTSDRGLKSGVGLTEVANTKMPACLVELEFHDWELGASHIRNNIEVYALALAQGILVTVGGAIPAITTPNPIIIPSTPVVGSYVVVVNADTLNIRTGAGVNFPTNGSVTKGQVFTIVETVNGWGKLKSGAGWIKLSYTTQRTQPIVQPALPLPIIPVIPVKPVIPCAVYYVHSTVEVAIVDFVIPCRKDGFAAVPFICGQNFLKGDSHGEALKMLGNGTDIDTVYGEAVVTVKGQAYAVTAIHCTVAYGDANIKPKAKALGLACESVTVPQDTKYTSMTNGLVGFVDGAATDVVFS